MKRFILPFIVLFGTTLLAAAQPATTETRAVWLDKSDLFKGQAHLTQLLDNLHQANFNTVYVATYFRGYVAYPDSQYLPLCPEIKEQNLLSWLIEEIHERGMSTEAWPEYGFYAFHTPDASKTKSRGVLLDKFPELTAIDEAGEPYIRRGQWGDFFSLCPSNPASHELLIKIFLEMMQRFAFDGINLDRIRYPSEEFCFCPYCKEQFKKDTGIDLRPFPPESSVRKSWDYWRKHQTERFVHQLATQLRSARPGVAITSAVVPPDEMNSKGQGWYTWLRKGHIDAAVPMLYQADQLEANLKTIRRAVGPEVKLICGLNADGVSPESLVKQINIARTCKCQGIAIWYSGAIADDLPLLSAGPFVNPAAPLFHRSAK
jgi:uncharacterized lipoprotein YddW (UPF0748 family)